MKSNIFISIIIISSIGPYIGFGLRLEHLFIYLFTILIFFELHKLSINKTIFCSLIPLFFSFVITVFFDSITGDKLREGNLLSSIDNLLEPILLIFIFSVFFNKSFTDNHFKILLNVIVKVSILAGLLSILTIFIDLEFLLKYFIMDIEGDESLWKQVLSLGRYIGLFSQPLEAGIYYTCSLFSLIYLKKEYGINTYYFFISFLIILISGLITLSKNFYLLGLVMSFLFYGHLSRWSFNKFVTIILSIICFLFFIFIFIIFDFGNYFHSLISLYEAEGITSAVTAGRFGRPELTEVEFLFNKFLNQGFFVGFGLGTHFPLDNGFLEYGYQGGILALLGYLFFLFYCLFLGFSYKKQKPSKFLIILIIYIFISSVGGPVITANRANIILILLICASIALINKKTNLIC